MPKKRSNKPISAGAITKSATQKHRNNAGVTKKQTSAASGRPVSRGNNRIQNESGRNNRHQNAKTSSNFPSRGRHNSNNNNNTNNTIKKDPKDKYNKNKRKRQQDSASSKMGAAPEEIQQQHQNLHLKRRKLNQKDSNQGASSSSSKSSTTPAAVGTTPNAIVTATPVTTATSKKSTQKKKKTRRQKKKSSKRKNVSKDSVGSAIPDNYNPLASVMMGGGASETLNDASKGQEESNTNTTAAANDTDSKATVEQQLRNDPTTSTLVSSQFRLLNEKFYVQNSGSMFDYLKFNPNAFSVYHQGFEQSKKKWKFDPFNWILPSLMHHYKDKCIRNVSKKRSKKRQPFRVIDMGCGKAELELLFREQVQKLHEEKQPQASSSDSSSTQKKEEDKNNALHEIEFTNIDMIASNDRVTVADMKDTKLPTGNYDAIVFCLSLMGTNYLDFLREAYRLLKSGGVLLIVELESRVIDPEEFMYFMHEGLHMSKIRNDLKTGYFQFYHFKKKNFKNMPDEVRILRLERELLMPSLYKKR